ncbi:TetR family transcriptional regulator [Plastoroseomonas arctica]|uniref:Helix-turn-helix transcriptional regulator n=1 Tax=Plastoroseomonas arctica TaxID=1509237 RepID=A0AAF1JW50_9PROT|nr:TetR family transcriptional regulator [Plastoroseomonas arctica]MBR0655096.1 helix-turn-helix transcriptional regulator [Plastoroseomonas arctica]
MDTSPDLTESKLIAGFWQVVALRGWHGVTMARVAAEAGTTLATLRGRFATPLDLLRLHGRMADQAVLAGTIAGQGGTSRDRIFDVLMRRLDTMQPHRAGIERLLDDVRRDPFLALFLGPRILGSMGWMLEAAELDSSFPAGAWRAPGLAVVWLATVRAWRADDSPDLGSTMAALDRALDRAEGVARSLRLPIADAEPEDAAPPPS